METATGAGTAIQMQQERQDDRAAEGQVQPMSPFAITRLLNNPDQRGKVPNRSIYASRLEPEVEYYGPSYRSSTASTPERAAYAPVEVPAGAKQEAAAVGYGKVDNDPRHDQVEPELAIEATTSSNGKRGTKRANEKQLVPGRRAEQNRKAQTAFRDRQAMRMRDLESQVETLGAQLASAKHALVENNELRKYIGSLQAALRQASVPCPGPQASLDQHLRLKDGWESARGVEAARGADGGGAGRADSGETSDDSIVGAQSSHQAQKG